MKNKNTLQIYGCNSCIYLKCETGGSNFLINDERICKTTGFYIEDNCGVKISRYYKTSKTAFNFAKKIISNLLISSGKKVLLIECAI